MQPSPEEQKQLSIVFSPLRPDLIFQQQVFKGESYFVIKDPLSLMYFRLQPEEAFLLQLLVGRRSLKDVLEPFHQAYPNTQRTPQELIQFCNQLARGGLLNIPARSFVDFAKQKPKGQHSVFMIWIKMISKILFFKIPLLDPSPWLGKMVHAIRFAWHPYFVWSCILFYASTLVWVLVNWADINAYASSTSFFTPQSFLLIWFAMLFIKTCHEFGHATTCRRFGGEVHEMGVCCICMMLCGYVDASDAWMMKKKAHKVYTTIAGIFTELMLAAIATYLWHTLAPGMAQDLMFRAMLIASINTIFFNMNPLMKFDGYYVLSDLLEIPNLRTKAITYCSYHLQKFLFGYRNTLQEQMLEGESRRFVFIGYAIAAYLYMATVIYGLSQVFGRFLEQFELKEFGLVIGIAAQISFLLSPIFKIFYDAFKPGTHIVMIEPVWKRLTKWGVGLVFIFSLMFVWPTHFHVKTQAIAFPKYYHMANTAIPGFIERIDVQTAQAVSAGTRLAKLKNIDIETHLILAEQNLAVAQAQLAHAEYAPERNEATPASLALATAHTEYLEALRQYHELTLYSPIDGVVATKDLNQKLGSYVEAQAPIIEIFNPTPLLLLIPITEEQVSMLTIGSPIQAKWIGSGEAIQTQIAFIASTKVLSHEHMHAMFEAFGGPLEAQQAGLSTFFAQAPLLDTPHPIQAFMRLKVDIEGQQTTWAKKWWRLFLNFWNLKGPVKHPLSQS